MKKWIFPDNYIKGYILFKKGYVTLRSNGISEIRSENNPDERPYIMKCLGFGDYVHGCGATARMPNALCKHEIADEFARFPNMTRPCEEVVEVFEQYSKYFSGRTFNKDMGLYEFELRNLASPKFAQHLWLCIFARLVTESTPRVIKNRTERDYEDLISNGKYLTARLKSLKKDEKDPISMVLSKFDGRNLNDVIAECEEEGLNAKPIIYRAFEERLFNQKRLRKAYLEAYKHCSDLNLVL